MSNELECLEIRLRTLGDFVDRFVVVEAPVTIEGRAKPLFYRENRDAFAEWNDRIVHVVLEDLPGGSGPQAVGAREQAMRNGMSRGLQGAAARDLVVFSDADEIPSPEALAAWSDDMVLAAPDMTMYHYWLNMRAGGWAGTRLCHYHLLRCTSPDYLRRHGFSVVTNTQTLLAGTGRGGWHFSWLGGPHRIIHKLNTYLHQELNTAQYADENWIRACMATGLDIFRRDGLANFVPIDERLPACLRTHRGRFDHLIAECHYGERFIDAHHLRLLYDTARHRSRGLGLNLELGCWEGVTASLLAQAVYPERLTAVDTWHGNIDAPAAGQGPNPGLHGRFLANVARLTRGNVDAVVSDHAAYLESLADPVGFAFIDGDHHHRSVSHQLRKLLPLVPAGGTLCGDDLQTAGRSRSDLGGGVERALDEVLPGYERWGNFWAWTRRA